MPLVDRYLLRELTRPFLTAVCGVLVMLLVNVLYSLATIIVQSHVGLPVVLRLLLYSLPAQAVITFPMAYLFAALLAFGRLGRDGELTALRAMGVSFRRLAAPVLVGAVAISAASFFINDVVVPAANHAFVREVTQEAFRMGQPLFKEHVVAKDPHAARYYFIGLIDRRTDRMTGIYAWEHARLVTAREGEWTGRGWHLRDGVVSHYGPDGLAKTEEGFRELDLPVGLDREAIYAQGDRGPREMSSSELAEAIAALKSAGGDTRELSVEYQMKFAIPLSTFFATLMGAPLGARFGRLGGFVGAAWAIALVMLYQVLMQVAHALGVNAWVDPITGAWLQNYVFGILGLGLLWWVDR
ncbi:MAG: putative permease [Cyanobacteria bacterium RYN_339]|nr:putative permease [Cyanobacteria bacterium RYN_339]